MKNQLLGMKQQNKMDTEINYKILSPQMNVFNDSFTISFFIVYFVFTDHELVTVHQLRTPSPEQVI